MEFKLWIYRDILRINTLQPTIKKYFIFNLGMIKLRKQID